MGINGYSTVVVGTDGSASATEAVRHAAELVSANGGSLHIVGAYKEPTRYQRERAQQGLPTNLRCDWIGDERVATRTIVEDAAEHVGHMPIRVFIHTVASSPAAALRQVAERHSADAIVVGNKGTESWLRWLRTPVASDLEQEAPCSVLVVDTKRFWQGRGAAPATAAASA
jgi:nucleotide-binding universal stress UspA family protein